VTPSVRGGANARLTNDIVARLASLRPEKLVDAVCAILVGAGYVDVRLTGGRRATRSIGGEIRAAVKAGPTAVPILVVVKVQADPVSRRAVDELRGRMAAAGHCRGVIATAGTFRPGAADAAGDAIDLIDGKSLAEMMIASGVGLRRLPTSFEPDETFFSVNRWS